MKTIATYSLAELKKANPTAYAGVLEDWANGQAEYPWMDETMDSLRAVINACGGSLRNWRVGPNGDNSLTVQVQDEDDQNDVLKDARWMLHHVLRPLGYVKGNGHADFPGHCKLTGYCADDDFLEAAYKSLKGGATLTEALEGLASDAGRMIENDLEQAQEEDSMLANWGDNQYTIDGVEV